MQVTAEAARNVLAGKTTLRSLLNVPPEELANMAVFAHGLWRQGRRREARQIFEALVAADASLYFGHAGLGLVAMQEEDFLTAHRHLARATQLEPDDPAVAVNLGEVLLRLERLADALPVLERAAAADPTLRNPGAARAAAILRGIGQGVASLLPAATNPQGNG
jgi:tetratricopeptide (TPR) repeat protein